MRKDTLLKKDFIEPIMIRIELRQVRLTGYHGLYPEEKKTGNEFVVELCVDYDPGEDMITDIRDTINYVELYQLLKQQFDTPIALLETLVRQISAEILETYPRAMKVAVSVEKLHPPIQGYTGSVRVSHEQSR